MRTLSALLMSGGLAVVAMGCGSNPGGGTKTLFVEAEAVSDGTSNGRFLAVQVREGHSDGNLVNDAIVTIRGDDSGEFNLPWEGINFGGFRAGLYLKSQIEWDRGWSLTVKRGEDYLDAYLVAPGDTTITQPIGNTSFQRGSEPLLITWKDSIDRRAEIVDVKFRRSEAANRSFSEDPLAYEVEPNRLVQADDERVSVERTNKIELAGGTPGSEFRATTVHTIEFTVE